MNGCGVNQRMKPFSMVLSIGIYGGFTMLPRVLRWELIEKILRKKERKHAFDQEKKVRYKKKERKHAKDQEKK